VDGWCTDGCTFFVPPCHWANQGGQLKLTFVFFFFFPSSAQVGLFFLQTFFPHPPCPPTSHLPTYRLLAYVPWPPPSPTYLPTCPLTHPSPYLPNNRPTY
jgi:hypothetical protein